MTAHLEVEHGVIRIDFERAGDPSHEFMGVRATGLRCIGGEPGELFPLLLVDGDRLSFVQLAGPLEPFLYVRTIRRANLCPNYCQGCSIRLE